MTSASKSHLVITALTAVVLEFVLLQPRPACGQQLVSSAHVNPDPIVESVFDTLAFIRWTNAESGRHDPALRRCPLRQRSKHLDLTAESPTRINPAHSDMIFRVRIDICCPAPLITTR